jgi:DNA polymerase III alpha subunit
VQQEVRCFVKTSLAELKESRDPLWVAGIVRDERTINTAKGRLHIFILDDGSTALEITSDEAVFSKHKSLIKEDQVLIALVKIQNDKNFNFINIIEYKEWEIIIQKIKSKEKLEDIIIYLHLISTKYNIDKKNIIKDFLNYIIFNKRIKITAEFLNFVENIIHSQNFNNNNILINYMVSKLASFL